MCLFGAQLACVIESGLHADYSTAPQMSGISATELETCDMHTAPAAVPGMTQKQQPPYLCCIHSACGQGSDLCTWCRPEHHLQRTTEQVPDLYTVAPYKGIRKLVCVSAIASYL